MDYLNDEELQAVIIASPLSPSHIMFKFRSTINPKVTVVSRITRINKCRYTLNSYKKMQEMYHICNAVVRDSRAHLCHNWRDIANFLSSKTDLLAFIRQDEVEWCLEMLDWSNEFITIEGWSIQAGSAAMRFKLGDLNLFYESVPRPTYHHEDFSKQFPIAHPPSELLDILLPTVGTTLSHADVYDDKYVISTQQHFLHGSRKDKLMTMQSLRMATLRQLRSVDIEFTAQRLLPFQINFDDPKQTIPLFHSSQDRNTKRIVDSKLFLVPQHDSKLETAFLATGMKPNAGEFPMADFDPTLKFDRHLLCPSVVPADGLALANHVTVMVAMGRSRTMKTDSKRSRQSKLIKRFDGFKGGVPLVDGTMPGSTLVYMANVANLFNTSVALGPHTLYDSIVNARILTLTSSSSVSSLQPFRAPGKTTNGEGEYVANSRSFSVALHTKEENWDRDTDYFNKEVLGKPQAVIVTLPAADNPTKFNDDVSACKRILELIIPVMQELGINPKHFRYIKQVEKIAEKISRLNSTHASDDGDDGDDDDDDDYYLDADEDDDAAAAAADDDDDDSDEEENEWDGDDDTSSNDENDDDDMEQYD